MNEEQYKMLIAQGYSPADIEAMIGVEAMQKQSVQRQQLQMAQSQLHKSSSMFASSGQEENLIKLQLDLNSILEKIEHMLRGDNVNIVDGNITWTKATDKDKVIFNDFGVSELMKIYLMYLNRNTILSNYKEADIYGKMFNLGNDVNDLVYLEYERFGLDTMHKRKLYPIVIRESIDMIHSAYLRALNGGERQALRENRMVSQIENLSGGGGYNMGGMGMGGMVRAERSILNPARYIMGKYK